MQISWLRFRSCMVESSIGVWGQDSRVNDVGSLGVVRSRFFTTT